MQKNILLAVILFSFLCGGQVLAQTAPANKNLGESFDQLGAAAGGGNLGAAVDPRYIVANIIRVALGILGTVFLVLIVYAGFLWMTATGEEDKIEKSKKILYQSVVGLLIILSAYAISYFVFQSLLGATATGNPFGYGSNSNVSDYGQNPSDYSP